MECRTPNYLQGPRYPVRVSCQLEGAHPPAVEFDDTDGNYGGRSRHAPPASTKDVDGHCSRRCRMPPSRYSRLQHPTPTSLTVAFLATKFESTSQEWETPKELFDPLMAEFGFTLDVCATQYNAKCDHYFTASDDALSLSWESDGFCWMNPPFNDLKRWVKKAFDESRLGHSVVCLLPCRTNTGWWHDYVMKGEIRFIRGRPKFNGAEHGLPQPLAIVIFQQPT